MAGQAGVVVLQCFAEGVVVGSLHFVPRGVGNNTGADQMVCNGRNQYTTSLSTYSSKGIGLPLGESIGSSSGLEGMHDFSFRYILHLFALYFQYHFTITGLPGITLNTLSFHLSSFFSGE